MTSSYLQRVVPIPAHNLWKPPNLFGCLELLQILTQQLHRSHVLDLEGAAVDNRAFSAQSLTNELLHLDPVGYTDHHWTFRYQPSCKGTNTSTRDTTTFSVNIVNASPFEANENQMSASASQNNIPNVNQTNEVNTVLTIPLEPRKWPTFD
jgi:hypothetical protein